ncbi:MAG TPA: branched-chain-amino-acid transaminase [Myxococcota bacterium]|nr:branched-chain-amino-acid transaminase [Myxococcota bacterium]
MSGDGSGMVWLDGELVDLSAARIPVIDHGLLYGDGLFEGMRIYGDRVFRLDRHLERLAAGARALALELPGGIPPIRDVVLATARAHGGSEAYVRLIVTRGDGALGVDPTSCPRPRVICVVDRVAIYPEEKRRAGVDLVTASVRRPPPDVLDPRVKSLNYLNNALAKGEARRQGADDALLLNREGLVAEAAVANVFAVREGALWTPPGSDGALEGINRATVLELAREQGIATAERSLGRFDLFAAAEVFLTGSGVGGLVPVRSLDGQHIGAGGAGPVFQRLRKAFEACKPRLGVAIAS